MRLLAPHTSLAALLCTLSPLLLLLIPTAHASSAAGQDTLIGVVGHDFIILGADSSSSSSVMLTSSNLDKIMVLSDPFPSGRDEDVDDEESAARGRSWGQQPIAAAAGGDSADADRLLGVLCAHCSVREYEAGVGCDVKTVYDGQPAAGHRMPMPMTSPAGLDAEAVAHLARGEIASSLRSGRGQLRVCLLIAGMVRAAAPLGSVADPMEEGSIDGHGDGGDDKPEGEISARGGEDPTIFSERIRRQVEAASSSVSSGGRLPSAPAFARPTIERDGTQSQQQLPSSDQIRPHYLTPRLLWLDEYGSLQHVRYGAHGFGSNFALSILDRGYRPSMTREEAADLVRDCFDQLRTRYVINSPRPPCVKCVDSDGCRLMR